MKAVIIDDEAHHRDYLKSLLAEYCPHVQLLAEADGVEAGLQLLRTHHPDLLLLDVEMQDGTGFDLLQKIQPVDFHVVFTTAHQHFALQAFRFSALDYLLKPIEAELLVAAVSKAAETKKASDMQVKLTALLGNIQSMSTQPKKMVLKDSDNIHLVAVSDIIRLEADSNYTIFHLADQRRILVSKTMKDYERMLEDHFFFRCHQSHMINLHYLQRIGKRDGGSVIMKDNTELPLSSRKRETLIALLEQRFS